MANTSTLEQYAPTLIGVAVLGGFIYYITRPSGQSAKRTPQGGQANSVESDFSGSLNVNALPNSVNEMSPAERSEWNKLNALFREIWKIEDRKNRGRFLPLNKEEREMNVIEEMAPMTPYNVEELYFIFRPAFL